jgi:hypothetical protein
MKTIVRANKDKYGNVSISFQQVKSFDLIKCNDIGSKSAEELKGYSDWVNSGNTLKAEFDSHPANIQFGLTHRDFSLDFGFSNTVQGHDIPSLKKVISSLTRIEKKICDDLYENNLFIDSSALKDVLDIVFKRANVIGGTISMIGTGKSFAKSEQHLLIDALVELQEAA